MNVRNCRRCGNLFGVTITDKTICPECIKKEEEDFETARLFVKDNPGCSMQQLVEETGINAKLIMKFVREQKLEFAHGQKPVISCERCGGPISSGRFCNGCLSKLGKAMIDDSPARKSDDPDAITRGMHYSKLK